MSSAMDIDPKEPGLSTSKMTALDAIKLNLAVWSAIGKYKEQNPNAFLLPDWLNHDDIPALLQILLKVIRNHHMDKEDCISYLTRHRPLRIRICDAYGSRDFKKLVNDTDMPFQPATSGMVSSNSDPKLKVAFEVPYRGGTAILFVKTLNNIRRSYGAQSAANRPYNWSLAVVQSSGMGKSRMVDESSLIIFTIPINIREEPPEGKQAYPPSDEVVRTFFDNCRGMNDARQQTAYGIFLYFLFTKTLKLVQAKLRGLTGKELAKAWAGYLKDGETDDYVGNNRQVFYKSVVDSVNTWLQDPREPAPNDLEICLQRSCAELEEHVQLNKSTDTNSLFLYLDEAHSLTIVPEPPKKGHERSPYHNLGTVISQLVNNRAFFIFLSTNSRLQGFAPPAASYPSHRVTENSSLIPPFTELPFDLYEREVLNCPLTLTNVCRTEVMVGFGRVLWYAELKIRPSKNIYDFAIDKLTALGVPYDKDDSPLAALGVHVGITFDKTNHASHPLESRLVESHLRVVYAIPEHHHFMHTGSPSEPILAEAASQHLNSSTTEGIAIEGPRRLSLALEKGLLARGERGELAGRLLVTCAHDMAIKNPVLTSPDPQYHRPLPVLDFLCALFHPDYHESILNAMPIIDRPIAGQPSSTSLRNAFSESYVCFSHFVLAEDSKMLSAPALATALVRGMAIQAKYGQASIDAVIPVHMGSLTDTISSKRTSAINLQFKNRKTALDCHVNRLITIPNIKMPVISIIFEFGIEETSTNPVSITSKAPRITRSQKRKLHRDDRHYQIVAHGCNSKVFGAIPSIVEEDYKAILGTGSILQDFP